MNASEAELGPIDVVIIGYPPGAPKTGEAIPILLDLVDRGIVRVLDALFVQMDADGTFSGFDLADLDRDSAGASHVVGESAKRSPLVTARRRALFTLAPAPSRSGRLRS